MSTPSWSECLDAVEFLDTKFGAPISRMKEVLPRVRDAEVELARYEAGIAPAREELARIALAVEQTRAQLGPAQQALREAVDQTESVRAQGENQRVQLLNTAQQEAADLLTDAKKQRAAMDADFASRKAALEAEVATLQSTRQRLIDEINSFHQAVGQIRVG